MSGPTLSRRSFFRALGAIVAVRAVGSALPVEVLPAIAAPFPVQMIDGVPLLPGSAWLFIGQAEPRLNGIWTVRAGKWERPVGSAQPAQPTDE